MSAEVDAGFVSGESMFVQQVQDLLGFQTLVAAGALRLVHARGTGGDLLGTARRLINDLARDGIEAGTASATPDGRAAMTVDATTEHGRDAAPVSTGMTREEYAEFLVVDSIPDEVAIEDVALFHADRCRALDYANAVVADAIRLAVDMIIVATVASTDGNGGDVQTGLVRRHLRKQLGLPVSKEEMTPAQRLGRIVASMIGNEVTGDLVSLRRMVDLRDPHVFFEGTRGNDALIYLRHVAEATADVYAVKNCKAAALVEEVVRARTYPWNIERFSFEQGLPSGILPLSAYSTIPSLLSCEEESIVSMQDATWHAIRTARFPAELREISVAYVEANRAFGGLNDSIPAGIAGSLVADFRSEYGDCDILLDLLDGLKRCASVDEAAGLFVEINQLAHDSMHENGIGAAMAELALIDRIVYPALRSRELLSALWRSVDPDTEQAEISDDDIQLAIREFIESCSVAPDEDASKPDADAIRLRA